MPDKKPEVLRISRLLSPEHRNDLLDWVRLAYTAENSVRKSSGFDVPADCVSSAKPQEYSCGNLSQRRKK